MRKQNKNGDEPFLNGARIIVVIGTLELGGAERQAIVLAQQLVREQNAEVEVWGYGKPGRAAELCDEYGIKWRSAPIPLPWSISRVEQLKRLFRFTMVLRQAKPDVILPFMFFQSVVCGLVWRMTGAWTCLWNQRCEGLDRLGRWAEKLAIRFTPGFIANSEYGADFLVKTLGVDPNAVRVIHNGVSLPLRQWNRETWRQHLGVNDACFLACMVANLSIFKDHVTLLKAWRIVVSYFEPRNEHPVLLLAGRFDGTEHELERIVSELKLGNSVRFLGQVKDISGLLGSVDLGVLSSASEGCPNGVLECMASGLAIAGTDCPGIREAVGPQGYEFLAPCRDPDALAERIIALAIDPEGRRRAGAVNRLRIETEFHPHKMYKEMISLIALGVQQTRSNRSGGSMLAENHEVH